MKNTKEQIDFVVDEEFTDSLSEPGEPEIMKGETFLFFYPLYHLYLIYQIISQIADKDEYPREIDLKKKGLNSSASFHLSMNFKKEIPIYRFIYDIMLNKIDAIKTKIDNGTINIRSRLDTTSLFQYAGKSQSIYGFNYLSVAAVLGRNEIFQYFLEKKANSETMIYIDTVNPAPIQLSVNECLIMNAIYKWYKSGKKQKIRNSQVNSLIDLIILASRISPSIVSYVHLLENGIRVEWYWSKLKEIARDAELLKRLIPLNSQAMKNNFGF